MADRTSQIARFAFDSDENYAPERLADLKARHPGEALIVGGNPLNPGWEATESAAKDLGLRLHRYEMGPGQPRSQNGNSGDNNIRRRRARALGVTEREYRNGVWMTDLQGRLADAKARGSEPYSMEIDDIEVVTKHKGDKTVAVYRQFQDWAKANGVATRIVPKNLHIDEWAAVEAAVKQGYANGGLDRDLLADVAISEEYLGKDEHAAEGQKPKGAAIAARMGITQVDTTDTSAYKSPPDGFVLPHTRILPPGMMKLGGPKPQSDAGDTPMSKAKSREAAARANLEAQGIREGTDAYYAAMEQMHAGRVPKRESAQVVKSPASADAFGTWDRITNQMENGTMHPRVERMYGPAQQAMRHSIESRGGAMRRAEDAGMMKLGGPMPTDERGYDRAPAAADSDRDGEIEEHTIATDAVDTYADSDSLGPGLHPRVKDQLDKAMDVMQRSQMARGVREDFGVFPGAPPVYEGGFSRSHDLAAFSRASQAFQDGGNGARAPAAETPQTGEGNWKNVREGGRGFANPAVQRAAQDARKK